MKMLIASFLLLCSASTFAAAKKEVVNVKGSVSVYNLQCVTRAGTSGLPANERTYTLLGRPLTIINQGAIKLKHTDATAAGCDLKKLDLIVDEARMFFGFVHEAPIEITTELTDSWVTPQDGKCIADYRETVKIGIGRGIVLESEEGGFVSMNDCK